MTTSIQSNWAAIPEHAQAHYSPPSSPSRRDSLSSTLAPTISTFRYNNGFGEGSLAPTRTNGSIAPTAASRAKTSLRSILKERFTRRRHEEVGDRGLTLLHRAAQRGDAESVNELLAQGRNVDIHAKRGRSRYTAGYEETVLYMAVVQGDISIVLALLNAGAHIDELSTDEYNKYTPLHAAALRNNLEMAETLLEHGAKVDATDYHQKTALWWAANKGHKTMVELLLDAGANIEKTAAFDMRPLDAAIEGGSLEVAAMLLASGADIHHLSRHHQDNTLLQQALNAPANTIGLVDLLLKKGASVDGRDKQGWTPLQSACSKGDVEAAQLLLLAGADPWLKTDPPRLFESTDMRQHQNAFELGKRSKTRSAEMSEMLKRVARKNGTGTTEGSGEASAEESRRGTITSLTPTET